MAKQILVYSTSTCPHCIKLKDFLTQNNIEFKNIDVASNPELAQEMFRKSGQMGVPVTAIDNEIIVGFDKEKIQTLLDL